MTPLHEQYRAEFPARERFLYLNHAAVAPLCRRAAQAMQELAGDALNFGCYHYGEWLKTYAGLRESAARLINATPEEIAIVKNTSEGISMVASGIDWRPGDKMVAFREEFPANYFPWKKAEQRGVRVEWLSIRDPLDRIDEACRGARLLSISFVQYLGGQRADLEAIGEICHRHGCLLMVDAIQGLGAFPLDVRRMRIHALAADSHKWLFGPEGCGILYVQRAVQDFIEPVEFGWTNVAGYNDYASRDMGLRPDAGRYECGTLNTIGCYGVRAALDFVLEVGVERIAAAVEALAARLAEGLQAKGCELCSPRTAANGSGIVSFRKPGEESTEIVRRLAARNMIMAPRQGWVRVSPHFYIAPEEIEEFLEAV